MPLAIMCVLTRPAEFSYWLWLWLKEYMDWPYYYRADNTLTDVFSKMTPYNDFLECKLLLDMSIEFLQDVTFNDNGTISNLSEAIESHSLKAKAVRASTTISTIQNLLEQKCYILIIIIIWTLLYY